MRELTTGSLRLVPAEFVYPLAALSRSRIVAETSSGSAAHGERDLALLAALCEAIERDALALFWYRQPRTNTFSVASIPDHTLRDELAAIQELGFVVAVCDLMYDLGVPVFLIVAMRQGEIMHGSGCHPNANQALESAVRELGRAINWLESIGGETVLYHAIEGVRSPPDHLQLYRSGPMHELLRQTLARTLHPASEVEIAARFEAQARAGEELKRVLDELERRGYCSYAADIVPNELRTLGIYVVRVLVSGLIPIHFGADLLRLGSKRLTGPGAPGCLRTVMPHFFA